MDEVETAAADPAAADGMAALLEQAIGWLEAGGPVVAILAAMSVAALAIVLAKWWQFTAAGVGRTGRVRRALALHRESPMHEARAPLERARKPLAEGTALAGAGRSAGGQPEETLRETATRTGAARLEDLRGYLRPLEVIASLSPLLGLFGTVLGMIEAFRAMEAAGSQVDPSILSGGIWEALLTTAVGLAVAIPAVAAHNWLDRRVERLAHQMEDAISQVFTQAAVRPAAEQDQRHAERRTPFFAAAD